MADSQRALRAFIGGTFLDNEECPHPNYPPSVLHMDVRMARERKDRV
jgi:hypothetical protein